MLKKIISLTASVFITLSLAGCMTTTTTSDVYYDDVSTYVVSGEKQQGNNSGTTSGNGDSKKPNGGDSKTKRSLTFPNHTLQTVDVGFCRGAEHRFIVKGEGPVEIYGYQYTFVNGGDRQ